jgi:hypothetical protein
MQMTIALWLASKSRCVAFDKPTRICASGKNYVTDWGLT